MKRHWIAIPLGLSVAGGAQGQLDNAAAESLMKTHGCASCHDVDRKVIGPAFRDVAARYKDDKEAATKLANKVKKGGAHVWGEMAMPPNVLISDAEIKDLVNWILTLKK
jgi:cytochrome c